MDPLHLCIALGPLAVYLFLLGMLNLSSRPFLTTGPRDTAALGVGVSGFVVAGPMELFLPETVANEIGGFVWLVLLLLYALCLILCVLTMRPRLVIYNVTSEQLRPILADVVDQLDTQARWAGESLVLPKLGVQLHVEPLGAMRNAQLIAAGPHQDHLGWRRLELALREALRKVNGTPNPYGVFLISFGMVVAAVTFWVVMRNPQVVAHSLREMLRL